MIFSSASPQPFRNLNKEFERVRNSYESEMWDDNSDVIFAAEATTLIFPVRVSCRVWITAQADTDTIGTLTINVNGAANRTANIIISQTGQCHSYADLDPGTHTITLTATGTLSDPLILVRRGLRPPTV